MALIPSKKEGVMKYADLKQALIVFLTRTHVCVASLVFLGASLAVVDSTEFWYLAGSVLVLNATITRKAVAICKS